MDDRSLACIPIVESGIDKCSPGDASRDVYVSTDYRSSFASPDVFFHIEAFLWSSNGTRFDGLAIHHSPTFLFVSPLLLPLPFAQGRLSPDPKRLAFATCERSHRRFPRLASHAASISTDSRCVAQRSIPFTISRRVHLTFTASSDSAGINGSKTSHSASVKSEGYAFLSSISSSPFLIFLRILLLSFLSSITQSEHALRAKERCS